MVRSDSIREERVRPQDETAAVRLRDEDAAVAAILMRNVYRRERHLFLAKTIVGLSVALCLSMAVNVALFLLPDRHRYFLTDQEGRIIEIVALDRPVDSLAVVSGWAAQAVAEALTFSFANYRQEFARVRGNFTAQGWEAFERALLDSGVLRTVRENQYVVTAVPTAAPVLVQQGVLAGRYGWRFQVPLLLSYESASARISQNVLVTVTIVRVPQTEHPRGLGIVQIVAQ